MKAMLKFDDSNRSREQNEGSLDLEIKIRELKSSPFQGNSGKNGEVGSYQLYASVRGGEWNKKRGIVETSHIRFALLTSNSVRFSPKDRFKKQQHRFFRAEKIIRTITVRYS
ncbi:hypothetical protein ACTXT7_000279 [Hymenolepis weldensis]